MNAGLKKDIKTLSGSFTEYQVIRKAIEKSGTLVAKLSKYYNFVLGDEECNEEYYQAIYDTDFDVDIFEAALGTKLTVPTPYGAVNLSIPAGVKSGQKLRLKGKGMPVLRKNINGDLYVVINIKSPEKLSEDVKDLLTKAQNLNPKLDRSDIVAKGTI